MDMSGGLLESPCRSGCVRRPSLQVVVLFASDQRVMDYALHVQKRFLAAGVDVFVQVELPPGMGGTPETGRIIKPDHLVNVITASTTDYLIVLGDRNMRNETCQARGNGRLMEVPLAERIRTLLRDWAGKTGMAISPAAQSRGSVQDGKEVAALSDTELWDVFKRYADTRLGFDRVSKLRDLDDILRSWGRTRRAMDPDLEPSLSLTEADRITASRLTKAQTAMVKLHEDVRAGKRALEALPTFTPGNKGSEGALGLGSGVPLAEAFVAPQPEHVGPGIGPLSLPLRNRLVEFLEEVLETIEEHGHDVVAACGECLWSAYFAECQRLDAEEEGGADASLAPGPSIAGANGGYAASGGAATAAGAVGDWRAAGGEGGAHPWLCPQCGADNSTLRERCRMCSTLQPEEEADEWHTSGAKRKGKQTKQRRGSFGSQSSLDAPARSHPQHAPPQRPRLKSVASAHSAAGAPGRPRADSASSTATRGSEDRGSRAGSAGPSQPAPRGTTAAAAAAVAGAPAWGGAGLAALPSQRAPQQALATPQTHPDRASGGAVQSPGARTGGVAGESAAKQSRKAKKKARKQARKQAEAAARLAAVEGAGAAEAAAGAPSRSRGASAAPTDGSVASAGSDVASLSQLAPMAEEAPPAVVAAAAAAGVRPFAGPLAHAGSDPAAQLQRAASDTAWQARAHGRQLAPPPAQVHASAPVELGAVWPGAAAAVAPAPPALPSQLPHSQAHSQQQQQQQQAPWASWAQPQPQHHPATSAPFGAQGPPRSAPPPGFGAGLGGYALAQPPFAPPGALAGSPPTDEAFHLPADLLNPRNSPPAQGGPASLATAYGAQGGALGIAPFLPPPTSAGAPATSFSGAHAHTHTHAHVHPHAHPGAYAPPGGAPPFDGAHLRAAVPGLHAHPHVHPRAGQPPHVGPPASGYAQSLPMGAPASGAHMPPGYGGPSYGAAPPAWQQAGQAGHAPLPQHQQYPQHAHPQGQGGYVDMYGALNAEAKMFVPQRAQSAPSSGGAQTAAGAWNGGYAAAAAAAGGQGTRGPAPYVAPWHGTPVLGTPQPAPSSNGSQPLW